jgi:hypothetical protein
MSDESTPVPAGEFWICHYSCAPWSEPDGWMQYFEKAAEILDADITHLDKNDPVRRRVKASDSVAIGQYLTAMGAREDSRWVFGKMAGIGVEFSVRYYRDVRLWPNSTNWYFPPEFVETPSGVAAIRALFDLGNTALSPFYAYVDLKQAIGTKKKESGSVNIQSELVGVFWLTFLSAQYVVFIGESRLRALAELEVVESEVGTTLCLGRTPSSVSGARRREIEESLRPRLFVDPAVTVMKRPGQYALTFDQLRS